MNTFFISPLIPLKFYILIQKEKRNPLIKWNMDEIRILNNINLLFNYKNILKESDKDIIKNIINKIINNNNKYENLEDKLTFVNQNTYKEITNYNHVYYNLLKQRNYEQIIDPYKVNNINICVGLSDTGPLIDIDTSKFKSIDSDSEKFKYIEQLIDSKESNIKHITYDIMSKSNVDPKINTITKILSNKSVLYYTLKGENFIPISESIDIEDDITQIETIITNFKENVKSDYFVIKPSEGTLSDGVGIFNISELNLNFIQSWTRNSDNNKYSVTGQYSSWILSEFIQSFLWKLQNNNITSMTFPQLKQKVPEINFKFDDKIGRINKFRFWALYTIIDGEFTSYLYKNGYCEIALEELTTYSKTQLDPANIEMFYQKLLNVEEDNELFEKIVENGPQNLNEEKLEAATVGTYLDFARVVNKNNYPLGEKSWDNILMPNMYNLVNTLAFKMKRFMNCLNKYSLEGSKCCYSFFALDIIIDDNSKPWLLETNSRPFVGFGNYWNKYDPENNHCLNVNNIFNTVLGLTTDIVNAGGIPCNYSDFLVTHIDKIKNKNKNKLYIPLSLGIKPTVTSNVYNKIYDILDENNYVSFPYPRQMSEEILNKSVGFRGMSPISKFLVSKIKELGNDKFMTLMQELFPYDAQMKVLNRISTLGFYLGDKAELTKILKEKVKNWDSIIPYSETVDISNINDEDLLRMIENSPLNNSTIIAKPAYGQQGKGIVISNDPKSLIKQIRNNTEDKDFVLSKYLDNPYLIKLNKVGVSNVLYNDTYGRKCHLRAYVLLHKIKNELKVYLYKESLIFCAAKEYNSCDKDKEYCNLTNLYFGSKYYKEYLNKNPGDAYKDLSGLAKDLIADDKYSKLMEQTKNIIVKTVLSVKDDLQCLNGASGNCYQYIAFDLHLENDNNNNPQPWLLEVNATPGLKSPDYQWKDTGGLNNFLQSMLNITIGTKEETKNETKNETKKETISDINMNSKKSFNKQLFEYLPFRKKIHYHGDELMIFDKSYNCMDNYYKDLKTVLKLLNYPGRSYLTTKSEMCNAIKTM